MILVHRLKGDPLYLNADLIEFVEARPDTVITLADGRKMVVAESPTEVVELSRLFRASVIVASDQLRERSDVVQLTVVDNEV
ncbi:MAG: flagellar FlbD family protein [Actinobacteria bacterium]|nr:flagellar FlbD family protein [Actinomycetota bacterium]